MGLIRTLLAISVLIGHGHGFFGLYLVEGFTAVQGFYVISGFYMSLVITDKYSLRDQWKRLFWANRYMRLAPSYLMVFLLSAITLAVYGRAPMIGESGFTSLIAALDPEAVFIVMIANLTMFLQDALLFLGFNLDTGHLVFMDFRAITEDGNPATVPLANLSLIPQAWSLGVELLFYAIAPFLLLRSWKVVLAVALVSYGLRVGLYLEGFKTDPWVHRFFPAELVFFLLGNFAYRAYKRWGDHPFVSRHAMKVFAGLVLLTLIYEYLPIGNREMRYGYLILIALSLPFVFALTRKWAWDNELGKLSYPIYISHMLVLVFLRDSGPWMGPLTLIGTLILSLALVKLVEDPIDSWRQRRIQKEAPAI